MTKEAPLARLIDLKARYPHRSAPECWVHRQRHQFRAIAGTPIYFGDIVSISGNTIAAFEFTIGGRCGLNGPLSAVFEGERSVRDLGVGFSRSFMIAFMKWRKGDSSLRKNRLEIQTNGGVIGIRG